MARVTFALPPAVKDRLAPTAAPTVDAGTVGEALNALAVVAPDVARVLLKGNDEPRPFIRFFLNGTLLDLPRDRMRPLLEDTTIVLLSAVAGG